jgi:hypothetical protein
MGHLSA